MGMDGRLVGVVGRFGGGGNALSQGVVEFCVELMECVSLVN